MPELPEVETVRRLIEPVLLKQRIDDVSFHRGDLRYPIPQRQMLRIARSGAVSEVGRRGKYLWLRFPGGYWIVHLGMSGNFYKKSPPASHVHVELRTRKGWLCYADPRRFGFFDATGALETSRHFKRLGPDAWLSPPDANTLYAAAQKRACAVKDFLMDQRLCSGIGNIYASEILFVARVSPRKRCGGLSLAQYERLARAIPRVLSLAMENSGTTFDSFRTPEGRAGGHFAALAVYARGGEPCRCCKTPVKRIAQGGRATYYCPACQRA